MEHRTIWKLAQMRFLSIKITDCFLRHRWIDLDDVEVCCYAVYRRLSRLLVGALLVLLGSIEAGVLPGICFTVTFLFMREVTGGYHATNEMQCVILSCIVEFVLLSLVDPLLDLPPCQWLIMAGGCICIILIAPVNDENIHLTNTEMRINAQRSWLRLAIIVGTVVIFNYFGAAHTVTAIQLSVFGVSASMLAATLKNMSI